MYFKTGHVTYFGPAAVSTRVSDETSQKLTELERLNEETFHGRREDCLSTTPPTRDKPQFKT